MDDGTHAGPDTDLDAALAGVEHHVAAAGWDQSPRLFALVDTTGLRGHEASLAAVEQEAMPAGELDVALASIAWPDSVDGAALVHEVVVLPSEVVEAQLPATGQAAWAAAHPSRREMRVAVGVLRSGAAACLLRLRAGDGQTEQVLTGGDLAPGLAAALRATLHG